MFKRILLSCAAVVALQSSALSAESLRFAHFMPTGSWQHSELFEGWRAAVEKDSAEAVNVTIFPSQTLGKAVAGYDNAKNGIADVIWTVQGYTAGRFPLSQLVELPGLFETAEVGSCAFQTLYDSGALDEEYKETHVLFVHTHGLGHLHTKDKPVRTLADLKGLKLRRPTTVIGTLLTELGAEPVGMPAPGTYEAVQRGTLDGYMLPWDATTSFRLDELSKYHTDFGFYSLAFVTTMNKAKYERLSPEAKKVIDDNSGMKWALNAGRGADAADKISLEKIKGNSEVLTISDEARPEFEAAAKRATDLYLAELDGKGLPGTQTYEALKGYVAECSAMVK